MDATPGVVGIVSAIGGLVGGLVVAIFNNYVGPRVHEDIAGRAEMRAHRRDTIAKWRTTIHNVSRDSSELKWLWAFLQMPAYASMAEYLDPKFREILEAGDLGRLEAFLGDRNGAVLRRALFTEVSRIEREEWDLI